VYAGATRISAGTAGGEAAIDGPEAVGRAPVGAAVAPATPVGSATRSARATATPHATERAIRAATSLPGSPFNDLPPSISVFPGRPGGSAEKEFITPGRSPTAVP